MVERDVELERGVRERHDDAGAEPAAEHADAEPVADGGTVHGPHVRHAAIVGKTHAATLRRSELLRREQQRVHAAASGCRVTVPANVSPASVT